MCGLLAGIGKDIQIELIKGLKRLEYRGYDSAGITTIKNGDLQTARSVGKFRELERVLQKTDLSGVAGIGHVRWATHGAPSLENAHPHATSNVSIVHNGIIENYMDIKAELTAQGYDFSSETDTEIVAKFLDSNVANFDIIESAHLTIDKIKGSYSLVFMFKGEDDLLFASCNKNPLILGIPEQQHSNHGIFLASDPVAFPSTIKKIVCLSDGDRVVVKGNKYRIYNSTRNEIERPSSEYTDQQGTTKGSYDHYMMKEIQEQPDVIQRILCKYISGDGFADLDIDWNEISRIRILACGSAYYAGLVSLYWFEELAKIPTSVEIASEYIYRNNSNGGKILTIIISQSGETLDTLEALKKAKDAGEKIISVVNVERSIIARKSDYVLPILAGPEIGVASTKAFVAQLAVLSLLAIHIGAKTKLISSSDRDNKFLLLKKIPEQIKSVLALETEIVNIAKEFKQYGHAIFLGRGKLFPVALEAALKLKELSYMHAEGYPSGELKHGPIALIDDNTPIACFMPAGGLNNKMFSNIQEVVARRGMVLSIISGDDKKKVKDISSWSITIPEIDDFTSPIIFTVSAQLLAYHVCLLLGNDPDQPRNLAKSVTVE